MADAAMTSSRFTVTPRRETVSRRFLLLSAGNGSLGRERMPARAGILAFSARTGKPVLNLESINLASYFGLPAAQMGICERNVARATFLAFSGRLASEA